MRRHPARHGTFWKVFGAPIVIAGLSVVGLFAALFGDGIFDALSWLALGIPLLVIARHALRPAGR